jgi:acyl-CoA dehydrogenase
MLSFDLTPEQEQLKDTARRFARDVIIPVAARYDEEQTFPQDVARKAWEIGLMNLEVPAEHGGPGLGVLDTCLVLEELNYGCAGITNAVAANGLATTPVLLAGTDAQKRCYLGQLTSECSFAAFCITEPAAGSDVAGMTTSYRRVGDEFVLNGTKHFISNGTVASWYTVFATSDRKLRHQGVTAFVFPADLPGIKKHRMKNKLGQRAADTGEVVFEEVRVPKDALLGTEGDGFKIAMRTFDRSRPEIGAIAIGVSQRALDEAVRYAKERQQFGQPIAQFQGVKHQLADMATAIEPARGLFWYAAHAWDHLPAEAARSAAIAKHHLTDRATDVARAAVELHGGLGFTWECDVQIWMKRALFDRAFLGAPAHHRARCAAMGGW